eukprot:g9153.t1
MTTSVRVETKTPRDAIVYGASDQGVGFFFNTFKKGRRTKSALTPANTLDHIDAFVTKIRPSTSADLLHVSPAWQGISFYEKNVDILQAHLDHLRRFEDEHRERHQNTLQENLRHRSLKYKKQRELFRMQRDRNKERSHFNDNSPLLIQVAPRIKLPSRIRPMMTKSNKASFNREAVDCMIALNTFDRKLETGRKSEKFADYT